MGWPCKVTFTGPEPRVEREYDEASLTVGGLEVFHKDQKKFVLLPWYRIHVVEYDAP